MKEKLQDFLVRFIEGFSFAFGIALGFWIFYGLYDLFNLIFK